MLKFDELDPLVKVAIEYSVYTVGVFFVIIAGLYIIKAGFELYNIDKRIDQ